MAPVHMKGYVLQKLLHDGPLWDPARCDGQEKPLFRYEVNAFGRERMEQSGLLGVIE